MVVDRRTGNAIGQERLRRNCALVKYLPVDAPVVEISAPAGGLVEDPRVMTHRPATTPGLDH